MRNAIALNDSMVVTIDNAGCIGELPADDVFAPNDVCAYYTTRTAIFEQWCAGAEPTHILLANFTGEKAWSQYIAGIERLFHEIGVDVPVITGSTETNFQMQQSAFSITMIGEKKWQPSLHNAHFFVVGQPLVGPQLIEQEHLAANLKEIYYAMQKGIIKAIWPTGSKGIGAELERFIGFSVYAEMECDKSAGPSTAVLVAVDEQQLQTFYDMITAPITKINVNK